MASTLPALMNPPIMARMQLRSSMPWLCPGKGRNRPLGSRLAVDSASHGGVAGSSSPATRKVGVSRSQGPNNRR
jgi:hypothetical protein